MLRLVAPVLLAAVSAAAELQFVANLGAQPIPYRRVMEECAGSSHATTTLRQDWREHLLQAKKDLGTKRVRFHGILNDDMSAYLLGGANMFNVFASIDWLLQNELGIIVELSFMPEALASDPAKTIFHYKGGTSPPKNQTQFGEFIEQFVRLLVARYGIDQVVQFRFEVWNEPNLDFWSGTQAEYFEMYATMARAIKRVDMRLLVGGPATAQLGWLPDLVNYTRAHAVPLDFLSSHLYPTDPQVNASSRTGFVDFIRGTAESVAEQAQLPLVITEFNAGLDSGLTMLNSAYAAAFVAHVAAHVQDMRRLDTLSYWTFSDVAFEEGGADSRPFHDSGYGMLNNGGVPKPVYHAMRMLRELPDNLVPVAVAAGGAAGGAFATASTVDVMVGSRVGAGGQLEVVVLVTNYNFRGLPIAAQSVTVVVAGLGGWCTDATARLETLDDAHVNPVAAWQDMGSPVYPTPQQMAEMRAASTVPVSSVPVVVAATAGDAAPRAGVRGGSAGTVATCTSGSKASVSVTVAPQSVTRIALTASR